MVKGQEEVLMPMCKAAQVPLSQMVPFNLFPSSRAQIKNCGAGSLTGITPFALSTPSCRSCSLDIGRNPFLGFRTGFARRMLNVGMCLTIDYDGMAEKFSVNLKQLLNGSHLFLLNEME